MVQINQGPFLWNKRSKKKRQEISEIAGPGNNMYTVYAHQFILYTSKVDVASSNDK